jgi:hypothetical protein
MPREMDFIPERKLKDEYEEDSDSVDDFDEDIDFKEADIDSITI